MIEIGAHTIDHSILATLPISEQQQQITQSKATLEEIIGKPADSFSYPYGTRSSYTADTVGLVADAGFTCACANFPATVRPTTDPYQIPRILIRDWTCDLMLKEMKGAVS